MHGILKDNMPQKVEISYKTTVFTVVLLLLLWLLFMIREIIFLVFVAFILMSAIKPLADYLERQHIPRSLGIILLYLLLIVILAFCGGSVVPVLISETIHLSQSLPGYMSTYLPFVTIDNQLITQQIAPVGENLVKLTIGIFGNIFALFSIFVISFYLLLERRHLESHLIFFMGKAAAVKLTAIIKRVEERLGAWIRGQISLMLVIGIFTFVALLILQLPYTLPLAIIAGILEIVPTVGPIISAIPAVLVGLTVSPFMGLMVILVYIVVQQIENHLVVPFVMKKVVGLPPVVTIITLLIGAKLAGFGGAILAVPVVVTIETLISEYFKLSTEAHKPDSVLR